MVSWKWQLLIHPQAAPVSVLLTATHPWLLGTLTPPFYTGRWFKSLPVSSLLCQLFHRGLHQRITKTSFQSHLKEKPLGQSPGISYLFTFSSLYFEHIWSYSLLSYYVSLPSDKCTRQDQSGVQIWCQGDMIYITCKSALAAHELSFHPNSLKHMKTGPDMETLSWKETQM